MDRTRYLPNADKLSVLSAIILLAYASGRFIDLPIREVGVQLPGFYLAIDLNIHTIVAFLVAGLTAAGANILLQDHPGITGKLSIEHWLLPALTAWTLGIPLSQLPISLQWMISFLVGGVLLMLVLVAEFIAVDPADERYLLASAGLTAVSYALFLILVITLRAAGLRLYVILPALVIASGLVSLRSLHLRLSGRWMFWPAMAITLIVGGIISALHYWPLSPILYGLAVLGPAYSLTSLAGALSEGKTLRNAIIEPAIVLFVVWGAAIWIA